jgi:hypothetical protein
MSLLPCCYRNRCIRRGVFNNDAIVDHDLIGVRIGVDHVLVIADKRKTGLQPKNANRSTIP